MPEENRKRPKATITRPDGTPVKARKQKDNARARHLREVRRRKKIRLWMRIGLAVIIVANIIIWGLILFQ